MVMVICLEPGANDLHMVQLMPLPPRRLLLCKSPKWFNFLVPAYPGCPGKRPLNGCSSSNRVRLIEASILMIRLDANSLGSVPPPLSPLSHHFYTRCTSCHNPPSLSWLGTGTELCQIAYRWLDCRPH